MYSERQKQMLGAITRGLGLAEPEPGAVIVEQSPSYIDSVIETADFAAAALGAVGSAVVKIGERRGLGSRSAFSPRQLVRAHRLLTDLHREDRTISQITPSS